MELFSPLFFPAVLKVLESNIPLLASIPIPKSGRDIPAGIVASQLPTSVYYLEALLNFAPLIFIIEAGRGVIWSHLLKFVYGAVARLKNHPGATVFTLSQANRDDKKEQIYRMVVNSISNSNC